MFNKKFYLSVLAFSTLFVARAEAETLRLLTWSGYAPAALIKKFKAETGIDVAVTLSNNEDMISKLRATRGGGFDLVTPSQDRVLGPQKLFKIYKPIDWSKINSKGLDPVLFKSSLQVTKVDGKYYGVPFMWGTTGLIVNTSKAKNVNSFKDVCSQSFAGKSTIRLRRIALIGMSYAQGNDPFSLYANPTQYQKVMQQAGAGLMECKKPLKAFWNNADDLMGMMRSGETVVGESWDQVAIKMAMENPNFKFVPLSTGALGWMDTFVLPARGKNDEAAYKWINFILRPENAAIIAQGAGNPAAVNGYTKYLTPKFSKQIESIYTPDVIKKIKWFPPIPPGIEEIEGRILDRVTAS